MEIDYSDDGALLHSVLMAATTFPEMLVSAWNSGADTSHWTHLETQMTLPDEIELCPSQLSISTPLHAAIAAANPATLKTALDLGCSPNTRALITGSQALTAGQYAIILGDTDAWSTLLAHPGTDASIITPVFCVHAMHFAAALLRPDLLRLLGTRLKDVGRTALGHTLLHIACLPHDEQAVQANALKVQQSIHDSRRVRTQWRMREACEVIWDASGDWAASELSFTGPPRDQRPDDWDELRKQEEVCRYLVAELGIGDAVIADVHGNTPLHYLASAALPNEQLMHWLREHSSVERAWKQHANIWGHTPQSLLIDAQATREAEA